MQRKRPSKATLPAIAREMTYARRYWSARLSSSVAGQLQGILRQTGLKVTAGEIQLLEGRLYVNHAGLLRIASLHRCAGIETEVVANLSQPDCARWVVKATVFKRPAAKHAFVGWGDAEPANISTLFRGAELRIAETRAVNRALRKAYAIGVCSAEEVGASPESELVPKVEITSRARARVVAPPVNATETSARGTVQDRLKLLIRDHELDPALILSYGLQFLGIPQIADATPEELEKFASHLEQFAVANCTWLKGELLRSQSAENLSQLNGKRSPSPSSDALSIGNTEEAA